MVCKEVRLLLQPSERWPGHIWLEDKTKIILKLNIINLSSSAYANVGTAFDMETVS